MVDWADRTERLNDGGNIVRWVDATRLSSEPNIDSLDQIWVELKEVAECLRNGGKIALPTETVYGLAADALNSAAVESIFELKGRPADNPLIVHISRTQDVNNLTEAFSPQALALASHFWPGPLTIVLPKRSQVPLVTTGGLNTVAIRLPAHPVARVIISMSERFLAAPSANRFMSLSPTRAQDIDPPISEGLEFVVDGGPCERGIESTVIDMTGNPMILRPGTISADAIASVLGEAPLIRTSGEKSSPGMYRKHYSPRTPVRLVETLNPGSTGLKLGETILESQISMPVTPNGYAQWLYSSLAELDRQNLDMIEIEMPPKTEAWAAIWDRLHKIIG